MWDVFISYSTEDKQIADAICHSIENEGIKCWIAPRDVGAGNSYASEIIKAIKNCKIVILVASKYTNKSQHVLNEVNSAVDNNKIILPFKIDSENFTEEYGYYLGKTHWIEAFPEPSKHFSTLIKNVGSLLEKSTSISEYIDLSLENERRKRAKEKLIKSSMEERLSFSLSFESDENDDFVDIKHHYKQIKRVDVLDSKEGKYSSYRWLTIENAGDVQTSYLYHRECGECKLHFNVMRVRAYVDSHKGEKLHVESKTELQPNFTQQFKIHFPKPLRPGESLKVFYRIDWPGEPNSFCLDNISTSVHIDRYKLGVSSLTFGIVEPSNMIDITLREIDKDYQEIESTEFGTYLSLDDDEDLSPLHKKGFKGVYYNIEGPEAVGYRIYYKLVDTIEEDGDLF